MIKGKRMGKEWVINGGEGEEKEDCGWIGMGGWKVGMFMGGMGRFDEVK